MQVERYNYAAQFGDDLPLLVDDLRRMLLSGNYVLAEEVAAFEQAFADFLQVDHVCGVNSGTDALVIALRALEVGPGDEVITQANTFNATAAAICLVGATPVLTDADNDTFLVDEDGVNAAITGRTRVIMPVHLFGKPTPMEPLKQIADRHGLAIVEDAAQSHGARHNGVMAGTSGTIGCFSFHPSKNLAAAGDGGALVTNDRNLAQSARELSALGQRGQNEHVAIGLNSKLDAIQARVLSCKLPRLDGWNQDRRRIAGLYRERLAGLDIAFQHLCPEEEHVFHLFQIRTSHRDALMAHLRASGIDAVCRYPTPIHLQPAFQRYGWRPGQFPVAERLAQELLCLPIRPDMAVPEVDHVAKCVHEFYNALAPRRASAPTSRETQ